ncbi:twin-arginine translocation signal domain-containing protein, partial [Streptomyces venezuelae]|uniref:twin-arginine translocation signal domain-containing protein n=1 Tax=Streptomyces venezuelae TaxID=54571 RepID=UPI0027B99D51
MADSRTCSHSLTSEEHHMSELPLPARGMGGVSRRRFLAGTGSVLGAAALAGHSTPAHAETRLADT